MKSIGKYKIIKNSPKPNISYPMMRLPSSHAHLIGEQAHVFETEIDGKTVFIVSTDEDFDGDSIVVQPKKKLDIESRLDKIEKELSVLQKSAPEEVINPPHLGTQNTQNEHMRFTQCCNDSEKNVLTLQETTSEEIDFIGGPDEIRTHDPRRVKAVS